MPRIGEFNRRNIHGNDVRYRVGQCIQETSRQCRIVVFAKQCVNAYTARDDFAFGRIDDTCRIFDIMCIYSVCYRCIHSALIVHYIL